ncbi:MAG: hypothetical protein HY923_02605 [Elusimicrobia bacterium]|nr:hypothetical protein [Elusimicrobiota bacterium]
MKYKIKDLMVSMVAWPSQGSKGPIKHYMQYLGKGCDGPCTCYSVTCGNTCGNTCDWTISHATRNHVSATEEMSFYSQLERQLTSHLAQLKKRRASLKGRIKSSNKPKRAKR